MEALWSSQRAERKRRNCSRNFSCLKKSQQSWVPLPERPWVSETWEVQWTPPCHQKESSLTRSLPVSRSQFSPVMSANAEALGFLEYFKFQSLFCITFQHHTELSIKYNVFLFSLNAGTCSPWRQQDISFIAHWTHYYALKGGCWKNSLKTLSQVRGISLLDVVSWQKIFLVTGEGGLGRG